MNPPDPAAVERVIGALAEQFGPRLSVNESVRRTHCQTLTWLPQEPPSAVVFAESVEEVRSVVRQCAARRVPLIPFGAGTSLEGQVNAPEGGICLDLSGMDQVLEVNADDLIATVQPGLGRATLNQKLADQGLFFPVDPGADASLGGMVSTGASGTYAVRYDTMRENVLALQVVRAGGELLRTGYRSKKSASGYDLTRLFVGAEGTLGVLTEVTLRLAPIPEVIGSGVCPFRSVGDATRAVIDVRRLGLEVARLELLNENSIRACNAYSGLDLAEQVQLFVEIHGDADSVPRIADQFGELAAEHGGGRWHWSDDHQRRGRLWQARHEVWWAIHAYYPGCRGVATDVCVPISRLAECVTETERDLADSGFDAPVAGHVGDGNFHVLLMFDPADEQTLTQARAVAHRMHHRALEMGGTITGEHGVGQGKATMMSAEHGAGLNTMGAIKRALDPDDILNPGKIFPTGRGDDARTNGDRRHPGNAGRGIPDAGGR